MDEVLIYSVGDGAVMQGWARDLRMEPNVTGFITFLADVRSELTEALGLVLDDPPVLEKLGNPRCRRFAAIVDDGVIKVIKVAGVNGATNESTFAESMLELL